ncbi:MAG: Rieske (2Fe-2S) protein [Candidatus Obscuribacterales bacterium]
MTQHTPPEAEPLWKDEFSIESAHETLVNRRQFTKFLTLTSLAMFVGNLWILGKRWLDKAPLFPRKVVGDINLPVGGVKLFRYPTENDPCIMVHTEADNFVAFTQKCTHLSCPVYYSDQTKRLECPCHEGSFSAETGEVIKGPPPRPLPRIKLERQTNGLLVAVGIETVHE